jgi:ubiquinone biosynthesis protein
MRENMGPSAELKAALTTTLARLRALPATLSKLELAAQDFADGGLKLHPDTLRILNEGQRRSPVTTVLWVIAVLLFLIWLAL